MDPPPLLVSGVLEPGPGAERGRLGEQAALWWVWLGLRGACLQPWSWARDWGEGTLLRGYRQAERGQEILRNF